MGFGAQGLGFVLGFRVWVLGPGFTKANCESFWNMEVSGTLSANPI